MADEINENVTSTSSEDSIDKYLDEIKRLKDTTVSKDDYEKLREENKKLFKAVIDERTPEVVESKASINELREKLKNAERLNLSNREFVQTMVDLRDAVIARDGYDPGSGQRKEGTRFLPSREALDASIRTFDTYKEWLAEADGDDNVFNQIFERNTVDAVPQSKRKGL